MQKTLIRVVLILCMISLTGYLFVKELSHVDALNRENEKLKADSSEVELNNQALEKRIELIEGEDKYIDKIIREELGMIKKGEKVYRFKE